MKLYGAAGLYCRECPWYEEGKTPHDEAVDKDDTKRMASYFFLINPLGSRREPQGEVLKLSQISGVILVRQGGSDPTLQFVYLYIFSKSQEVKFLFSLLKLSI